MEKIKAIEILLMNPRLNLVQLRGFRYFAIDRNGSACVYSQKPTDFIKDWDFHTDNNGNIELVKYFPTPLDWRDSLREIDFEEQESNGEIELIIKKTSDWLMTNTSLDVSLIVDLSEHLRKVNL